MNSTEYYYHYERESLSMREQVREFLKGAAEMSVELGKGCRDIVKQSLIGRDDDSFLVKNFGKDSVIGRRIRVPLNIVSPHLRVFSDYLLPEDKDPLHAWFVILFVFIFAFAALSIVKTEDSTVAPLVKEVYIHPPSADRILLPDGRYMAYREEGVAAEKARFSIIAPHAFLSSRLAGVPGLKVSLLEEFGVRLLTYDLPGFGESDPHPNRNLESSALDMSILASCLGVSGKFWVVGYSSGSLHAWAALRYIPDKLAGAAMFAPLVNPYDSLMTREEKYKIWEKWTRTRKFMYFLARRFPRFLAYFYYRSFLTRKHRQIDKWLSLSLGKRDRALIEDPIYEEFWLRDVEESIRQGNAKPFVEEAVLQVSNWGFSLADLKLQKKRLGKGILNWLKSLLRDQEEYTGFFGPIHIWQGMDDRVVPPSMTDFVHRVLPGAAVHKLPYEGHFTYFYFCDECHRQIFTTLFGIPQGPLDIAMEVDQNPIENNTTEVQEEVILGDCTTD
ncbi:Abhydrolase_6 domain-containing protein [Cephalotus follicularis]|uniref:Abhydrolase_6 domain-containing protein n=1 Tax=Cephalotus follicularis TaxID=3775 RepID=A0A1Q3B244_CEPFO|nr:Abhydrolase_6 domain-containing protein [Cephalotus follicularis]